MKNTRYKYALGSFWKMMQPRHVVTALTLLVSTSWLQAQTTITDGADFNAAITGTASSMSFEPASGGTIATVANSTTGTQGTVTYSSPFAGVISFSTTIAGNGNTLTGSSGATPLFLASPLNETATGGVSSPTTYTVSVSDLFITGGVSQGGEGASGGAGLGGAIFVGTGYQLTLSNVTIVGNFAIGGNTDELGGGGGGLGGNASFSGDGGNGGGGLFANAPDTGYGGGANGGTQGAYPVSGLAGGFGGGGANPGSGGNGGAGGFGGGGGDQEGNGGFGGGGGNRNTVDGSGGFGGGGYIGGFGGVSSKDMGNDAIGGAGAGFGGGIFVQNNASVLLIGNDTIFGNTVTGGTTENSSYGNPVGAAAGADIFIMTGSSVTLAPGTGNIVTIGQSSDDAAGQPSDVADDSVYSVSGSYVSTQGAGSGAQLTIGSSSSPGGLVVLHGNNTYAGGTVITNGVTLEVFQDNNLGAYDAGNPSVGNIAIGGAEMLTGTDGFVTSRLISITGSAVLAAASNTTATYNGQIAAPLLTLGDGTNNGTIILTSTSNLISSLNINGATAEFTSLASLGGVTGTMNFANGGVLMTNFDGFTTSNDLNITDSGSLETAAGTTATYNGVISGGALGIGSATNTGEVILTGSNTYTGGTSLNGGTLKVSSNAGLGLATSGISMSSNSTLIMDFSGTVNRNISMDAGAVAATEGNTVTLQGSISSSNTLTVGDGSEANDGTVILTGTNTYSGATRIDHATLKATSGANLGQGSELDIFDDGELVTMTDGSVLNQDTTLDSSGTLAAAAGTSATYNGRIFGGTLTVGDSVNNGTVILTGDNAYVGDTEVSAGATLEVSDDKNLGASFSNVRLGSGAELLTNATGGFSTDRTITFTSSGILAAFNNTTATYNGTVSGTFSIGDSTHHGTVTLGSAYTGDIAVNGGAFQVNNDLTGNVTVNSGGQVGGSGTIHGNITVASGGSTYPGDPQILTATSVEYQSGSKAQFDIATTGSSPHPPVVGTDYDQMNLTGAGQVLTIDPGTTTLQLNLTAATLSVLQDNTQNSVFDNYYLFTLGSGTSSGLFSDLTLSIDGTLYTEAITNGVADFTQFNLGFDLSYTADSTSNSLTGGHDLAVEVVYAVPEPSTYAMLLLGLGVLFLGCRANAKRRN